MGQNKRNGQFSGTQGEIRETGKVTTDQAWVQLRETYTGIYQAHKTK
jgi:hypothetical protein